MGTGLPIAFRSRATVSAVHVVIAYEARMGAPLRYYDRSELRLLALIQRLHLLSCPDPVRDCTYLEAELEETVADAVEKR